MSNILYLCPICKSRLFAPASLPIYKCFIHTDTMMEPAEEYKGPNFEYKDVDEVNPGKTGVLTHGAFDEHGKSNITVVRDTPPEPISKEQELKQLRETYERIAQRPADKRLGIQSLRNEIEQLERDHARALEVEAQERFLQEEKAIKEARAAQYAGRNYAEVGASAGQQVDTQQADDS